MRLDGLGVERLVTASNRVKPRAADSSICRTVRLTAGSRINFGWLTRPHSRRMLRYNTVPTVFSRHRMRASRSSLLARSRRLWCLRRGCGVAGNLGNCSVGLASSIYAVGGCRGAAVTIPAEGRIPLRQLSGSARQQHGCFYRWRSGRDQPNSLDIVEVTAKTKARTRALEGLRMADVMPLSSSAHSSPVPECDPMPRIVTVQ